MRFFRRDKPEPTQGEEAALDVAPATAQAAAFVDIMGDLAPQVRLDFTPQSLKALDAFIGATFEGPSASPAPDSLQADVGAYVGEVIRRNIGGTWSADGSLRDVGGEVSQIDSFGKARKRFANGDEDSLAWFYEVVRRHAGSDTGEGPGRGNG